MLRNTQILPPPKICPKMFLKKVLFCLFPSPYPFVLPCCIRRGGHLGGEDKSPLQESPSPPRRASLSEAKGGEREGIKRVSFNLYPSAIHTHCSQDMQNLSAQALRAR